MNKNIQIILGIIVLVLIGWFFVNQNTEPEINDPVKIGVIVPLTGNLAAMGKDVQDGMMLAVEDINSKNDRQVEVIYEDSKGDPAEGVSIINKMIDIDNINYVYCFGTPVINAIQPITEEKEVVLVAVSLDSDIVKDKKYTLRLYYNAIQFLDDAIEFINKKDYSGVATLYQKIDTLDNQVKYLEDKGISFIKKETFQMGDQDFRTTLLKIKESNPEAMIVMGYGFHYPSIFKQMEELGMKDIEVIGNIAFIQTPKESISLYDNAIFSIPSFRIKPTEKSNEFIETYKNSFEKNPNNESAYAYDTIKLIYEGVLNSDGSALGVSDYIKGIEKYEGAVGEINMLSNGDSMSSIDFAVYDENGETVLYEF